MPLFPEAMARTRCWGQGGILSTENKESKNTGGAGASEQFLDSPQTVKKLTFALLDKIFESRPSLLAELKSRAEKEVEVEQFDSFSVSSIGIFYLN